MPLPTMTPSMPLRKMTRTLNTVIYRSSADDKTLQQGGQFGGKLFETRLAGKALAARDHAWVLFFSVLLFLVCIFPGFIYSTAKVIIILETWEGRRAAEGGEIDAPAGAECAGRVPCPVTAA
jgi:hypothetical protein